MTPTEGSANPGDLFAGAVKEAAPAPTITIAPADNTIDVPLDAVVKVTAEGGTLTRVHVTSTTAGTTKGEMGGRRTVWTSTGTLDPDTVYRVEAEAVNADGRPTSTVQTFSTVNPTKVIETEISPSEGSEVGVGMPISVKFSEPIKNKAEVEKRLSVQTSKPVEGAWRWFGDEEVHYRPKDYWPAHTQVTVRADLRGVRSGSGAWGLETSTRKFSTTNSVVTKVNLVDHHARVYVDGKLARTIPVTGGKAGWRTRNGTKVILDKVRNIVFTNEAIGAPEDYTLTAAYALRVTWSGEFLHSADWSAGSHGRANVSHGCVGMSTANSEWLYNISHVGDPVEMVSPEGGEMEPGNGYADWNYSWAEWKSGSALG